jgi:hypothetical protein
VRSKILEIKEGYEKISCGPFGRWGNNGVPRSLGDISAQCDASISIITEAPEWELNVEKEIVNLDPLVIMSVNGEHWLIEQFDVTPMENIAAREFTL